MAWRAGDKLLNQAGCQQSKQIDVRLHSRPHLRHPAAAPVCLHGHRSSLGRPPPPPLPPPPVPSLVPGCLCQGDWHVKGMGGGMDASLALTRAGQNLLGQRVWGGK